MKFPLLIAIILYTTMTQPVLGENALKRSRRQDIPPVVDETKQLAAQANEIIEQVLPKLPATEAYAKYRSNLQMYKEDFHTYKERPGYHRRMASNFLKSLNEFLQAYSDNVGETPERLEVAKFLNEAGLEKLRLHVQQKIEKGEYRHLMRG
ncbi:uncharacterized protein LOC142237791 [Haematobia irritans]|uniref:uncharacterized protein LOC142237791 n=1 Tax=Haematobia irritans TaxID=7368 RepID=UPI003F5019D8